MNLKKLKEQFIRNKFQKIVTQSDSIEKTANKIIHSVAILTSEEIASKVNPQKEIEEKLKIKNCSIFKFSKSNTSHNTSFDQFSKNDFNWQGKNTNVNLQRFLDEPFDLLISFFDANNLYLEYATLLSNASFKVGFANVNQVLFDIEIAAKIEDSCTFISELNRYLKLLKKLEN